MQDFGRERQGNVYNRTIPELDLCMLINEEAMKIYALAKNMQYKNYNMNMNNYSFGIM